MKKQILFALAFADLAVTGNAQRYYYRSAPWDGNKTYILNVGTDFNITPRDFGPNSSGLVTTPGISTMVQAKYFFTDEFFASFNIHDDISLSFFSKEFAENTLGKGGQRGVVMLGVGYKFFR